MATIMCLPDEVINVILGYSDITIEDIINFRCVCKQFRSAAKYNKHQEIKFVQRWSSSKKLHDEQFKKNEQKESEENEQKDKESLISFIKTGKNCARKLRKFVSQIIDRHYYEPLLLNYSTPCFKSIDNCVQFQNIFCLNKDLRNNFHEIFKRENFLTYSFFIDELKNLITQSPRTGDLTKRYCNTKIFYFMRQYLVRKKWHSYEERPSRNHLFERMATIVAQWIQPQKDVFYSFVQESLDNIALDARKYLREKHPDHSIFSTSAETLSYWKNNNIEDNYWNEAEGTQIMDALQEYIYNNLNFQLSDVNDENGEDTCIDYVLKNKYGKGIILLIIYHSVARRLGLRCDILQISRRPYKFCLYWKPKYDRNRSRKVRGFNELFKKLPNYFMKKLLDYIPLTMSLEPPPIEVNSNGMHRLHRVTGYKAIIAVEIWRILLKILKYQRKYIMGLGFNIYARGFEQLNKLCLYFKRRNQLNRPENIKFAVGMIVKHSDVFKNNCTGVIIGWHRRQDEHIKFVKNNDDWSPDLQNPNTLLCIMPLHICCSYYCETNTNYIILTENNEMCYVEEDAITLTTPKWIDNSEIGRYFCKFKDTHYVPNKMLSSLYPQDAAITAQTIISEN